MTLTPIKSLYCICKESKGAMMNKLIAIAIALLVAPWLSAIAANEQDLEAELINTLRLKKGTLERVGKSGPTIQAYIREGYLNNKPNQRSDYTDYYLLKKPTMLMGHTLVVIEEEYASKWIGCCPSPGLGVTLMTSGSTKNIEKFANENGCNFSKIDDLNIELKSVRIKSNFPKGNYASLSCRERDVQH